MKTKLVAAVLLGVTHGALLLKVRWWKHCFAAGRSEILAVRSLCFHALGNVTSTRHRECKSSKKPPSRVIGVTLNQHQLQQLGVNVKFTVRHMSIATERLTLFSIKTCKDWVDFFNGLKKSKLGGQTHPGFLFCVHGASKSRVYCKLEEDGEEGKLSFQQFERTAD